MYNTAMHAAAISKPTLARQRVAKAAASKPVAAQASVTRTAGAPRWFAIGLLAVAAPCVWAQQAPPPAAPARQVPRPDELEPGVNTSTLPALDPAAAPGASRAPASGAQSGAASASSASGNTTSPATKAKAAASKPSATDPSTSNAKSASQPKSAAQVAGSAALGDAKAPKPGATAGKAQDRLQLDATQITGNQELPKVLYIVPWKRSDLGDLIGQPPNSLLDEVLEPVDRDVFKRENRYYDALKPDAAAPAGAATGATSQGPGEQR